jgi:hypothetical protein
MHPDDLESYPSGSLFFLASENFVTKKFIKKGVRGLAPQGKPDILC